MECSIDIETFSSIDLAASGVYRYVEAPDFDILLIAYSVDGGEVEVIDCQDLSAESSQKIKEFKRILFNPDIIKKAFNANFERTCLAKWTVREMPPEEWRCTMIKALTCGLPGTLAGAGAALGLPEDKLKDPQGRALIQYFCKPCKPTRTNGGRTRNMPYHDPDKWKLFIEYNRQDVVTEMAIAKKLDKYKVTSEEQELWSIDQNMNDRGVLIDVDMVEKIVAYDALRREELQQAAVALTGLRNPNSLMQLKGWLAEQGVEMSSVTKDTIEEALKGDLPEDVRRMLLIRTALGKTSTAKYSTMLDAACEDHRLRGILQFYGANRTGRWAGRLVQTHNLARNSLPDLALARELAASGDFETMQTLFGEPAFVFSELVRTAFIPAPGRRFIVSDFSAIEARVLAWAAGEEWVLDAFRNGKDIYSETASMMYKVPVEKHGQNAELRQKGKVATLACIAEGQLVLTNYGEVPIENVTTDMKLWDGENWVEHDGVIYKGEREVISYEGLTATRDHIVWCENEGKPRTIPFGEAAESGAHLIKSGAGGQAIRLGENYITEKNIYKRMERLLCVSRVRGMREKTMDRIEQPYAGEINGLPELLLQADNSALDGQATHIRKATLRKRKGSKLSSVWCERHQIRVPKRDGSRTVHDREFRDPRKKHGAGPHRHEWQLCARKCQVGGQENELSKSKNNSSVRIRPAVLALCGNYNPEKAFSRSDQRRNYSRGEGSCTRKTEGLENHRAKDRVYDIRNAGPHHRFTVSGALVHNCGYQGGVGAMKRMDSSGSIPEEEMQAVVTSWRNANPHIVRLWYSVEEKVKACISGGGPRVIQIKYQDSGEKMGAEGIKFNYAYDNLFITLPSGRKLCYWQARLKEDPTDGREHIVYKGVNQETKQWGDIETYGGRLVENIIQAIARDCLAEVIKRVTALGYKIVMHVHDEIIVDAPKTDTEALAIINAAMAEPIPWAPGLPLKGDGYETPFYMKD